MVFLPPPLYLAEGVESLMKRSNLSARISSKNEKTSGCVPVLACLAFLVSFVGYPPLSAQEKSPFAGDPQAVKLGEYQFGLNCAFCHGLGARGGGRGPDLTRAQKHHGNSDAEILRSLRLVY
jgi:mono/diheme cytochrome c family protein